MFIINYSFYGVLTNYTKSILKNFVNGGLTSKKTTSQLPAAVLFQSLFTACILTAIVYRDLFRVDSPQALQCGWVTRFGQEPSGFDPEHSDSIIIP